MNTRTTREDWLVTRVEGWTSSAARWVFAAILYLTLSGLAIDLLPFSVFNQHSVLLHTLVGLVFLLPLVLYLARHVRAYWSFPLSHLKFSGYLGAGMVLVCCASGVVLTWESAAGTRITYLWRTVHALTTYGVLLFLGAHMVALWLRASANAREDEAGVATAARGHQRLAAGVSVALLAVTGVLTAVIRPTTLVHAFPADYDMSPYEGAGPFSPSLATTRTGGALDERTLSGSDSCGTSGCHEEIYAEWLPSAHRYSSMDVAFQAIQGVMAQQNGATSTRYCGGCHDPISLFAGTKNIGVDHLSSLVGYQEGISCLACHSIEQTDVAGNAKYVMREPDRYVYELREGPVAKFLSDFLIRSYPDHHVEDLSHRMFKTPEFCAACHKQFIDEEVNQVGWVQLQNQFDNWRASRWHHEDAPERTVECRECHMPLVDSRDPAAGDEADSNRTARDGKHRSHRFLGANQYIPVLMAEQLPGGPEHAELVHRWLRGELDIPEIAEKWADGPAVPIELRVPDSVREGEELRVVVNIINNKVGHDFPTGPLDIIQAWVEVDVTDAAGHVVFETGKRDERNFIDAGSYMFKAEPVDRYGNLIDRHNLWEMVGVRFKRSLFPGSEEAATFAFECSGASDPLPTETQEALDVALTGALEGPLTVRARLNYRKFDQYLLNFAFGEDAGLSSPVTVLSAAERQVELLPRDEEGE